MPFDQCINNFATCLSQGGLDPGLASFISILLGVLIIATLPLVLVIFLIWVERKFAARIQDRLGPNRVGPYGLIQTVPDALKLITKEDITPDGADKLIYNMAPVVAVLSVILIWVVIPFSPIHIGSDLEIGVPYFVAVASIGTLAILIAGWSSNNKFALLGAFRVIAQLVSYEVPMILALMIPIMLAGSLGMQDIVEAQRGMWFALISPIAAILFFISSLAEVGRSPFDLIEAESELVAGFNVEYSGMKFGMFYAAEFLHAFTICALTVLLYFGGWVGPFVDQIPLLGVVYLGVKTTVIYLFHLLMRNTLPRLRIDQVMSFNWKFLVPLSIVNVLVIAFLLQVLKAMGLIPTAENQSDFLANIPQTLVILASNLLMLGYLFNRIRNQGRSKRMAEEVVPTDAELAHAEPAH